MDKNKLIPDQITGHQIDVISEIQLLNLGESVILYQLAKKRLMEVNNWQNIIGKSSAKFVLTLPNGETTTELKEGNLIKIDIPGPGSVIGDGYDWVCIEKIAESSNSELEEWYGFRLRPYHHPQHQKNTVAHFYKNTATSTFIVGRNGLQVYAKVIGRNELANKDTSYLLDKIRNTIIGWSAKLGFSLPQWKLLTDRLVAME